MPDWKSKVMQHRTKIVVSLLETYLAIPMATSVAIAAMQPPSADLAKKCRELAVKTYPPTKAGAGSGHAAVQREYFQRCIASGGNVDQSEQQKQQQQ
jgi:hypothetical protein